MANEVYANNFEISCKAANGKSVAAFPDVCLSPPSPPAGPVPIPYPNTGFASDATQGSKTVSISGKEVMLKDQSYFKKSTGDEAATRGLGMGVLTHTIQGKVYFISWSMDVMVEGQNVDRHIDMTTHNHNPAAGNSPPWMYVDAVAAAGGAKDHCKRTREKVEKTCTDTSYKNDQSPKCCKAKKCVLAKYGSQPECCDGKTKHHVVPDHCFKEPGEDGKYYHGIKDLSYDTGLCVCASGVDKNEKRKQHAKIHKDFDKVEDRHRDKNNGMWTFGQAKKQGAKACAKHTGCNRKCLEQQVDQYYKDKGVNDNTALRADSGGNTVRPDPRVMGTRSTAGTVGR